MTFAPLSRSQSSWATAIAFYSSWDSRPLSSTSCAAIILLRRSEATSSGRQQLLSRKSCSETMFPISTPAVPCERCIIVIGRLYTIQTCRECTVQPNRTISRAVTKPLYFLCSAGSKQNLVASFRKTVNIHSWVYLNDNCTISEEFNQIRKSNKRNKVLCFLELSYQDKNSSALAGIVQLKLNHSTILRMYNPILLATQEVTFLLTVWISLFNCFILAQASIQNVRCIVIDYMASASLVILPFITNRMCRKFRFKIAVAAVKIMHYNFATKRGL